MKPSTNSKRHQIFSQFIFLIVFLVGLFTFLFILGVFSSKAPKGHQVTYYVDGSTPSAMVTFTQDDGGYTSPFDIQVPWTKTINFTGRAMVILTAGNSSHTGSIQCKLLLDGKEWKKQSAVPPEEKVACAGIVP